MSCDRNMRTAAEVATSGGISRMSSKGVYYSAERLRMYEVFDEALGFTDVGNMKELLDLLLRDKRPRRKERTAGQYLAAGVATGVVMLNAKRLRKREKIKRLYYACQRNRLENFKAKKNEANPLTGGV